MYGLVLEGGGSKGAYHIGAYQGILENKLEIGAITGTSIGALNGAIIAQGDYDKLRDLWENLNYSMLIDLEDLEDLEDLDLKFYLEKLVKILKDGGLDIGPLRNLISEHVDESKLRASNIDFGMVTINLTEKKALELFIEDIPKGELVNFLLASAYLPAFKTETLNGSKYLDGAFYDNLPFGMLKKKGYDKLIIIRTNAAGITRKIDYEDPNLIIIEPKEDLGRSLDCNRDRALRNIRLGYLDSIKVLEGLIGQDYYIKDFYDEFYFYESLEKLTVKQVRDLEISLRLSQLPYKRSLFENILPKLASLLGLGKDYSYKDILIGLLEFNAKSYGLERLKIYRLEELISLTNEKSQGTKSHLESMTIIDRIMYKIELSTVFNREEVLREVYDIIFKDYLKDDWEFCLKRNN